MGTVFVCNSCSSNFQATSVSDACDVVASHRCVDLDASSQSIFRDRSESNIFEASGEWSEGSVAARASSEVCSLVGELLPHCACGHTARAIVSTSAQSPLFFAPRPWIGGQDSSSFTRSGTNAVPQFVHYAGMLYCRSQVVY